MQFLVAVDGSEYGARALDHAVEMAEAAGAGVTVVHAVEPRVYTESLSEPVGTLAEADRLFVAEEIASAEERGERLLDRMRGRVADRDIDVETLLLYGDPVVEIADYADEHGYDGVYVGHRGVSERYEALLGSVAKGLVGRASVPVTVVH